MLASTAPSAPTARQGDATAEVTRRARLMALGIDLALLGSVVAFALGAGTAWLLLRTGFGAEDPATRDTAIALALLLATVPGWFAFTLRHLLLTGSTPGQRRAAVKVEGTQRARIWRFITHPAAAVPWLWLAFVANLAMIPALPLMLVSAATIPVVGGLITALLVLRAPASRGIHDLIAGTRLAAA